MLILGIESSAVSASAAITRDGALLGQCCLKSGLTHSQTLLPMAEELLRHTGTALGDLDAVAVAQGPGSFTGVRIGVATAKGLCWGVDKPAIGVSTLEAMARGNGQCAPEGSLICCAMDARRGQVYNTLFRYASGVPERKCADRAISLEELAEEMRGETAPVYVLGDGAVKCAGFLRQAGFDVLLAPEAVREQNAWGVCLAAAGKTPADAAALLPVYLRLSQAERERQERMRG